MELTDILTNLYHLRIYTENEWKKYVGFFDGIDEEITRVKTENKKNEIKERICDHRGAAPVETDYSRYLKIMDADQIAHKSGSDRVPLGMVSGSFDLLHLGHLQSIEYAGRHIKERGGKLCALLLSDHDIRVKKGLCRPVLDMNERISMVSAVRHIDYIIPMWEPDCCMLIRRLKPRYYYKSRRDMDQSVVKKEIEIVKENGGSIEFFPQSIKHKSTTQIIRTIEREKNP